MKGSNLSEILESIRKPTIKTYMILFKLAEKDPQINKYLIEYFEFAQRYLENPDAIMDPAIRALVKTILNTKVGNVKLAAVDLFPSGLVKTVKPLSKLFVPFVSGLTGYLNLLSAYYSLKPHIDEYLLTTNYTPSDIYTMLVGVDPEIKNLPKEDVLKAIASVLSSAPSLLQNLTTLATAVKSLAYGKTGIPIETYMKLRSELSGMNPENVSAAIKSLQQYLTSVSPQKLKRKRK